MPSLRNPVLAGFYPDPSVCRVGDDYYLVTSSFEYFPGVPIFRSRNLVEFEQIGHVLTRRSQLELEGTESSKGIFAPTLRHHDGTFYLITTHILGGGNFLVTAENPRGPWSEPMWLDEGMDPSLFFDEDGTVYYTRHGEGERGGVYQTEIDVERGTLLGTPRLIWKGTGGIWPEGPHLYKRGGLYYLLIAEGGTSYQHAITVARSASPYGPFEANPKNPILTHRHLPEHPIQALGHGDLVETPQGDWWMVFLGIRPATPHRHHLGRETFLAPVDWEDGWPVIGQPIALESNTRALPGSGEEPGAPPPRLVKDDFDAPTLAPDYVFVRNPDPNHWSLSERPGWLRLRGDQRSLAERTSPAFIGRRQQEHAARIRALLEFEPSTEGQEAGLALRANETHHYRLALLGAGAARRAEVALVVGGRESRLPARPVPPGPLTLGIDARPDAYDFWIESNGVRTVLGCAETAALSSEVAGGFTGVVVGPYAQTAAGCARAPAADFDAFELAPAGAQSPKSTRI